MTSTEEVEALITEADTYLADWDGDYVQRGTDMVRRLAVAISDSLRGRQLALISKREEVALFLSARRGSQVIWDEDQRTADALLAPDGPIRDEREVYEECAQIVERLGKRLTERDGVLGSGSYSDPAPYWEVAAEIRARS